MAQTALCEREGVSIKQLPLFFQKASFILAKIMSFLNQEFQLLYISGDFLKHPALPSQFLHTNMLSNTRIYVKLKILNDRKIIQHGSK